MTDENKAAVIQAALTWLEAKEAMLAADVERTGAPETQHDYDQAEYDLTDALYRLRGGPPRV